MEVNILAVSVVLVNIVASLFTLKVILDDISEENAEKKKEGQWPIKSN